MGILPEGLQALLAVGQLARLHARAERIGQLPRPEAAFLGRLGMVDELLDDLHPPRIARFHAFHLGDQFLRFLAGAGRRRRRLARPGAAWKKKPIAATSGWPSPLMTGGSIVFQVLPTRIKRADLHLRVLVAGLDDGHDVLVDLDVAGRVVGACRHDPRAAAAELQPFRLRRDGLLPLGQRAEVDGRLGELGGHGLALGLAQPERLEFLRREQHAGETIVVAIGHRGHDFGGDFFRRDGLPGRELAVADRIDAPAGAGRIEPAELVLLACRLGGHIAINFDAVLVEAPLIDHVIAVGVEEFPQQDAFRAFDDPTDVAIDLFGRNLATRHILGLGPVVIDPVLAGGDLQNLGGRGAGGQNRRRTV